MDDEDHVDLVKKAEQEFFECVETEKSRRERELTGTAGRKDPDDDEKHDRGKVCALILFTVISMGHIASSTSSARCGLFLSVFSAFISCTGGQSVSHVLLWQPSDCVRNFV